MIVTVVFALILNFSYMKKENIIAHQVVQINRVEARNYADWMSTIIETFGFEKKVYTNFKSLTTEIIPGIAEYIFLDDDQIEKLLFCQNCDYLFLLKIELLQKSLVTLINENSPLINCEILYNDGTFVFLKKKSS